MSRATRHGRRLILPLTATSVHQTYQNQPVNEGSWPFDVVTSLQFFAHSPHVHNRISVMMDSAWAFQDDTINTWGAAEPSLAGKFDDDLFSAALLFLDQPYGDTDSDSHSTHTTELEPCWETGDLDMRSCSPYELERPLKIPRTSSPVASVKLEPAASGSVPGISALWEPGEHSFRPTPPRRVNKRKEEISVLRVEAEALQAHLDALSKQPQEAQQVTGLFTGVAWQNIAFQQSEQRKQAEDENRRLKEIAAEQRRVAKTLKRIAARHSNSKSWDPFRSTPARPPVSDHLLTLNAPGLTEALLASLDRMLEQTDSMLSDKPGQHLTTQRHGNSHLTVQLQDCRILPFPTATTASAVWKYTLLNEDVKEVSWMPVHNGALQSEFVAFVDLGEFQGHAEGKIVVRRLEEAHRTVIVRHSLFHCLTPEHKSRFLTAPMRHFLWTVIDRPPDLNVASGRDTISRIRTCDMSVPRLDIGDLNDPTREREIEDLQRMCSAIAQHQCELSYDIVDNILLGSSPPKTKAMTICHAGLQRKGTR